MSRKYILPFGEKISILYTTSQEKQMIPYGITKLTKLLQKKTGIGDWNDKEQ